MVATPRPPEATPWFRIGSAADHCVEQHICWLAVSIMFVFTVYIIYNIYVYVCMHVYMYVICMLYQHYVHHLYSFIHHHPAGHQLRHVILQSWGGVATWGRAGFGDDPRRSSPFQKPSTRLAFGLLRTPRVGKHPTSEKLRILKKTSFSYCGWASEIRVTS